MKTYIILDWAGNDLSAHYGEFESFEDAWGALYEDYALLNEEDFDAQMSEFEVLEKERN
jgi:hypothetical protein